MCLTRTNIFERPSPTSYTREDVRHCKNCEAPHRHRICVDSGLVLLEPDNAYECASAGWLGLGAHQPAAQTYGVGTHLRTCHVQPRLAWSGNTQYWLDVHRGLSQQLFLPPINSLNEFVPIWPPSLKKIGHTTNPYQLGNHERLLLSVLREPNG